MKAKSKGIMEASIEGPKRQSEPRKIVLEILDGISGGEREEAATGELSTAELQKASIM